MDNHASASHAAVSIALRVLQGVLTDAAQDDMVSLKEIEAVIKLIERGTVELDKAYAAARERYEGKRTESRGRFRMRNDPLHRLIVRPFESMFFDNPPGFSRQFLPAYFDAARVFLGADYGVYDGECRNVIQALLATQGAQLSWDMVYSDGRAESLMRRVVGVIALKLRGDEGWNSWTKLMLKPAADGSLPSDAQLRAVRDRIISFLEREVDEAA